MTGRARKRIDIVKQGIHPTFYTDAVFTCGSCGTTWRGGSTKRDVHVDICSNCHPFFTGTQRIVDTAGQVERFTKRLQAREAAVESGQVKGSKKQRRAEERAKRSGMLEAMQPEPTPEPVAEAAGTETVAQAESAPEAAAPRERRPRPPRERKPRENKPAAQNAEQPASAAETTPPQEPAPAE
jgi:large subunit ribosomal protein L31